MARNKKPRKAYKAREIDPTAQFRALGKTAARQSMEPLSEEQRLALSAKAHAAAGNIVAGTGTSEDGDCLVAVANICRIACLDGLGIEHIEIIDRGRDAVELLRQRYARTGRVVFDGPGLQAVNELLEYHDALLWSGDLTEGLVVATVEAAQELVKAGRIHHLQPQHVE